MQHHLREWQIVTKLSSHSSAIRSYAAWSQYVRQKIIFDGGLTAAKWFLASHVASHVMSRGGIFCVNLGFNASDDIQKAFTDYLHSTVRPLYLELGKAVTLFSLQTEFISSAVTKSAELI